MFKRIFNWFKSLFGFEKVLSAARRPWRIIFRGRIKQRVKKGPVNKKGFITFYLNDPTTPNLVREIRPPQPQTPKYAVSGYRGGGHKLDSPEGRAANIFMTITNTLRFVNGYKKINKWAATSQLAIRPNAGNQLNAFYNRLSLQFFSGKDEGKIIYTANSADIVAHELGHAILDAYRPDTWNTASLEVWSYHEAFADFISLVSILQHDKIIRKVLRQTGGDLRKNNVAAMVAEEVGNAIYNTGYLRNAINDFKYVNPGSLSKYAPRDKLASESHSFGRIFLGAFYEMMVRIYEVENGGHFGLTRARMVITSYVIKATVNAPVNVRFFKSIAKSLLWVAKIHDNGKYYDVILDVLVNRNLAEPPVRMLHVPEIGDFVEPVVAKKNESKTIQLCNYFIGAQTNNPLYSANIEMPQESAEFCNEHGTVIDSIEVTKEESVNMVHEAICYLDMINGVGDENSLFQIKNGNLIRNLIS